MYEVVLEDENGELTGFATEAKDEEHASDLAKHQHPGLSILGILKLEESEE